MANKLEAQGPQMPSLDQTIKTERPGSIARPVESINLSTTAPSNRFADRVRAQIAAQKEQDLLNKLATGLNTKGPGKGVSTKKQTKSAVPVDTTKISPKYINAPSFMRTLADRLVSFFAELLYFIREFLLSGPRFLWRLVRGTNKVAEKSEEAETKDKTKKKPERVNRIQFG